LRSPCGAKLNEFLRDLERAVILGAGDAPGLRAVLRESNRDMQTGWSRSLLRGLKGRDR
jgi:hypothetical protein